MIKNVTGVILAGGKSSRFGSNKALASLDGIPVIKHIAVTLESIFPHRLLITDTPDTYDFLDWPAAVDQYPGAGPLAGIHAALSSIKTPRALVTGCDMPFLDADFIRYLCSLQGDWDVVLPCLDKGPEPLCALYDKNILQTIEENLKSGQRKIQLALSSLTVRQVHQEEIFSVVPSLTSFLNINRQDDLKKLRREDALCRKKRKGCTD